MKSYSHTARSYFVVLINLLRKYNAVIGIAALPIMPQASFEKEQ